MKTSQTNYHLRDIQHVIDLTPGVILFDLSQHGMDLIMHIEIKWQVNELSLEAKQKCIIPNDVHFYKDKFWSYIVKNGVGQTKDVVIYDRSTSKIFEDAVIREHDALQTINFSFITVKLKSASLMPLLVCISFIFIAKTGKPSHTSDNPFWSRSCILLIR